MHIKLTLTLIVKTFTTGESGSSCNVYLLMCDDTSVILFVINVHSSVVCTDHEADLRGHLMDADV